MYEGEAHSREWGTRGDEVWEGALSILAKIFFFDILSRNCTLSSEAAVRGDFLIWPYGY